MFSFVHTIYVQISVLLPMLRIGIFYLSHETELQITKCEHVTKHSLLCTYQHMLLVPSVLLLLHSGREEMY